MVEQLDDEAGFVYFGPRYFRSIFDLKRARPRCLRTSLQRKRKKKKKTKTKFFTDARELFYIYMLDFKCCARSV